MLWTVSVVLIVVIIVFGLGAVADEDLNNRKLFAMIVSAATIALAATCVLPNVL